MAEFSAISGSAAVSITARNVSFIATHAWVQDVMAFVSFCAGMVSILTFITAVVLHSFALWKNKRP